MFWAGAKILLKLKAKQYCSISNSRDVRRTENVSSLFWRSQKLRHAKGLTDKRTVRFIFRISVKPHYGFTCQTNHKIGNWILMDYRPHGLQFRTGRPRKQNSLSNSGYGAMQTQPSKSYWTDHKRETASLTFQKLHMDVERALNNPITNH